MYYELKVDMDWHPADEEIQIAPLNLVVTNHSSVTVELTAEAAEVFRNTPGFTVSRGKKADAVDAPPVEPLAVPTEDEVKGGES